MGTASSVLESEKTKPFDLSDLDGADAIKNELIRIRTLLAGISFVVDKDSEPVIETVEGAESDGEEEDVDEDDAEARAAARKKRLGKTGPGMTRSGRKQSVMSQNMRIAMAHTVGQEKNNYAMSEEHKCVPEEPEGEGGAESVAETEAPAAAPAAPA